MARKRKMHTVVTAGVRRIQRNMYRTPALDISDDGKRIQFARTNERKPVGQSLANWIRKQLGIPQKKSQFGLRLT